MHGSETWLLKGSPSIRLLELSLHSSKFIIFFILHCATIVFFLCIFVIIYLCTVC